MSRENFDSRVGYGETNSRQLLGRSILFRNKATSDLAAMDVDREQAFGKGLHVVF